MESIFDALWKRRAISGDRNATDRLADDAIEPLYRFCFYRVGRNRQLCEEVVQETLMRVIADLEKYEPERADGNIFPWLTGLARNEIHRVLSREKATASLQELWQRMDQQLRNLYGQLESEPFGKQLLEQDETRELVNATMSQLPSHYRDTLEAKYVAGKSVRDIAAALNRTEKTIESQLTRDRKAFRETFLALTQNLSIEASG